MMVHFFAIIEGPLRSQPICCVLPIAPSITAVWQSLSVRESERGDILETVSALDERKSKSVKRIAPSESGIRPGH
jgi:hypothetical protein